MQRASGLHDYKALKVAHQLQDTNIRNLLKNT